MHNEWQSGKDSPKRTARAVFSRHSAKRSDTEMEIFKNGRIAMNVINKIALITVIIGALNWGSIGLFSFDLVAWISGGATSVLARIIYTIVALAGVWCITLLFRHDDEYIESHA